MDSSVDPVEILAVRGLGAGYGGRPVVAGIGMTLDRGDILGLLGANSSGKSTLLKAITGQIRLLQGSVAIDGRDLASAPEPAKAGFGLAIDPPELPAALTGRQYLQLVASIRGCTENDWPGVEVVERLGLRRWLERPIAEYSLGTQAKIAIAAALLGAPPLLIFDESLNGLDPLAAFEVKRIIRAIALRGQPRGHHLHPYRGSRSRPLQPRGASGRGQHCPRVGCPAVGRGKPRARRF